MSLMEADMGITSMAMDANQNNRFAGDEYLLVKFFSHPKMNEGKSKEEGRPIFEELDYIQIMQPGNKDSIIVRPATGMDKERFPEHFKKYKARESQEHVEGTLLEEWPGINRGQCEELKFMNIRTVEQLAGLSDANAQNIMGIQMLKAKAANYLENAADNATKQALAEQKEENERLRASMAEMIARMEALEADEPAPKKRGRPKKVTQE